MSSAKSVAKELFRLSMSGPMPDPLTSYRLQSLAYYAQAWSLVLRGSELFPDEIACAEEGPVVPAILEAMEAPAWQIVRSTIFDSEPNLDTEDEALFLRSLWAVYRSFSASELQSAIQEESSFLKAKKERERGGKGLILMNELDESFRLRPCLAALGDYHRLREEQEKQAERAIQSSLPLDVEAIWKECRSITPSAGKR